MAQIREISGRISSVKSTQKITRAMKMVAAARLNRAIARMEGIRKYSANVARSLLALHSNLFGDEHPLLKARPVKRRLYIVIAGDRGLCGGFNNNVARYLAQQIKPAPEVTSTFYAVGRRATAGVRKQFGEGSVAKSWMDIFDKLPFQLTNDVAKSLLADYQSGDAATRVDEVFVVSNSFASRLKQEVVIQQLMPLNFTELKAQAEKSGIAAPTARLVYEIHPSSGKAISALIEHQLSINLYGAITESYAAELSARVTAMESATEAAQEMVDDLTLLYNRARQTGITNELLDIIGGANALG